MNKLVVRIWAAIFLALFVSSTSILLLLVHYFGFYFHDPAWYPLERTARVILEILENTAVIDLEKERVDLGEMLDRSVRIYDSGDNRLPESARSLPRDAAPVYLTAPSGAPFFYAPIHDGKLVVAIDPATSLYRPTIDFPEYLINFSFFLVITIPIGFVLSRSTTSRIKNLECSARKFSKGDTTARIQPVRGGPIGDVESCFNQMAHRIHRMVQTQQLMLVQFVSRFQTGLTAVREALETKPGSNFSQKMPSIYAIVEDLEHFVSHLLKNEKKTHNTAVATEPSPSGRNAQGFFPFALRAGFRSKARRPGTLRFMSRLAGGILVALLLNHFPGIFISQFYYRYASGTPEWYATRTLTALVQYATERSRPDSVALTIETLEAILERDIEMLPKNALPPLETLRSISGGRGMRYGRHNGRRSYFLPLVGTDRVLVVEAAFHLYRFDPSLLLHLSVIPLEFLMTLIGTLLLSAPILLNFIKLEAGIDLFRQNRLDTRIRIPLHRPAGPLAACLNDMADRIQALVQQRKHLLQAVAHEVRTPLSRIFYHLETDSPGRQSFSSAEMKKSIMEEITELEGLVRELGAYVDGKTFRQSFSVGPVGVGELIDEIVSYYRKSAPEIRFRVLPPKDANISVAVHLPGLRHVLHNIFSNAVRYADKLIAVSYSVHRSGLFISISDDGPGIPADKRTAVFEPFHRLDQSRNRKSGGFGLGLAIARRIISGCRGDIIISDNLPTGTKVTVNLPPQISVPSISPRRA